MSIRFRQRIKICPGVYINLSGQGLSVSAGIRGASVTLGPKGTYLNAGVPGTGLSMREKIGSAPEERPSTPPERLPAGSQGDPAMTEIKSAPIEELTSAQFKETKELIATTHERRLELLRRIKSTEDAIRTASFWRTVSKIFIIGFFVKSFDENVRAKRSELEDLQRQLEGCPIDVDMVLDEEKKRLYSVVEHSHEELSRSARIWSLVASRATDAIRDRSTARASVERTLTEFGKGDVDVIRSAHEPLCLKDPRGLELLIYPALAVVSQPGNEKIAILGLEELEIKYGDMRFTEREAKPSDAKQVSTTWAKANMDGSPDRRFKGNFQIPIMLYGLLVLKTKTGLDEYFMVSNQSAAKDFASALQKYQEGLRAA